MKKHICMLVGAAILLAACEQKTETVNPPAQEKKESNTTIVNPSPATTNKTETNTTINTQSSPAASATP
jgi:PBP1b-binding outer membrane lipoprotein LpoB